MQIAQKRGLSGPLVVFSVLGRRTAHDLYEFAYKIVAVFISDVFRYAVDLFVGVDDLSGSFFDPVICQVVFERHPVIFLEDLAEIRAVDMISVAQILKTDVVCIILLYVSFNICKDTPRNVLAEFRQIDSKLRGKLCHVLVGSSGKCFSGCLFGNILDDLFLVYGIIKFAGKMDKLEEEIIDVKIECPAGAFLAFYLY